ncbi:ROK family glucokinase [Macrococcoides bohemicum]|uniref:Glucokinase n=1 Tax=Macrococcoides bohemicum TaxID=1903056 RepID=A0AAJ4TVM2_9STAP|nr:MULTISPECIES: ROK family glucokinase [Macrococcus]ATD30209.1 glucokinase [Macrococcus sp. IME1552]MBC9873207.1 ROK family glucokinase [Macrococcus bohemicus]QYA41518.1 ROK family glucokinase [Macrococcus bohemicus]QYA43943.1 ROK family glucokinase [Macrococcus bohemicus]TDL40610.1 ROK family glucokinase [Macrococcus bohemicus]
MIILAADIGGTTCKLGVLDETLEILHKWEIPTKTENNGESILKNVYDSFVVNAKHKNYKMEDVLGIGLGIPGPIDFKTGVVNGAINLNWHGKINIKEQFEKLSGLPVYVDNDANVATLGEKFKGAGQNEPDVICVTLGTGVGGGIISNNELVHGHNGSGGELGHFKVDFKERFQCNCGKKGCLETVASATGVVNLSYHYYAELQFQTVIEDAIKNRTLQAKMVFDAAKAGDEFATYVIKKVARNLAYALSIFSVVTNPKYIIIGGGVSKAGNFLIQHIEDVYREITFTPATQGTKIVTATLGNDAGIIGAAGLIKQYVKKEQV